MADAAAAKTCCMRTVAALATLPGWPLCCAGNVARFINHSCDPNLLKQTVLVEGSSAIRYKQAFVAGRCVTRASCASLGNCLAMLCRRPSGEASCISCQHAGSFQWILQAWGSNACLSCPVGTSCRWRNSLTTTSMRWGAWLARSCAATAAPAAAEAGCCEAWAGGKVPLLGRTEPRASVFFFSMYTDESFLCFCTSQNDFFHRMLPS